MKKLVVALTVVIFAVGLALPVMAVPPDVSNSYHVVYEYVAPSWVEIDPGLRYAEMFSKISNIEQYRFESAEGTVPGTATAGVYQDPEPELPLQKTIINRLHLFPWIDVHFNETLLIWDIFKPGNYMAKAFVIWFRANCPVFIHFGHGTFDVPVSFLGGEDNGEIVLGPYTKTEVPEHCVGDKERQRSLLPKIPPNPGTDPDVIDVMWWWTEGSVDDWNRSHLMTNVVPKKTEIGGCPAGTFPIKWVPASIMCSNYTVIPDTDDLHVGKYITFYEDIDVEYCDSEGKYLEEFVITICPDP